MFSNLSTSWHWLQPFSGRCVSGLTKIDEIPAPSMEEADLGSSVMQGRQWPDRGYLLRGESFGVLWAACGTVMFGNLHMDFRALCAQKM